MRTDRYWERRRRLIAVSAALLVVVPACAEVHAPTVRAMPMSACVIGGYSARCGTLSVPEDRARPSGRHIDLRVAVIPAVSADSEG